MISIVMSTYNDSGYLSETIDTVLAQSFIDFEFIIINDGSPDPETQLIIGDYAAKDSRIKVISKANEGLTRALIDGCNDANGEYIARVDVGDMMLPNRLQLQKEVLDAYWDVGFVSCWTEFCAPEWELMWTNKGKTEVSVPVNMIPKNLYQGLSGDIAHHGSVMFRKSIYEKVDGYRWQFYLGQDWDLWYRMAEKSKFYLIPQVLYRVRILPDGISMTMKKRQDQIAECSKGAFVARMRGEDDTPFLTRASEIRPLKYKSKKKNDLEPGYYFIAENLRHRDKQGSRKYFFKAINENLFSIRAWIRLCQTFV